MDLSVSFVRIFTAPCGCPFQRPSQAPQSSHPSQTSQAFWPHPNPGGKSCPTPIVSKPSLHQLDTSNMQKSLGLILDSGPGSFPRVRTTSCSLHASCWRRNNKDCVDRWVVWLLVWLKTHVVGTYVVYAAHFALLNTTESSPHSYIPSTTLVCPSGDCPIISRCDLRRDTYACYWHCHSLPSLTASCWMD